MRPPCPITWVSDILWSRGLRRCLSCRARLEIDYCRTMDDAPNGYAVPVRHCRV